MDNSDDNKATSMNDITNVTPVSKTITAGSHVQTTTTTTTSSAVVAAAAVPNENNTPTSSVVVVTPASKKKKPPAIEVPTNLLDNWIKGTHCYEDFIGTKDAKKEYFLDAHDLAYLPCERVGGGIGCGAPMKIYPHDDLVHVSLQKHGRLGVTKKLEAKYKREAKKRQREEQAAQVLEEQQQEQQNKKLKSDNNNEKTAAKMDTPEIKKLRSSLFKMAKKNMGFQASGSPKNWRVQVPGTTAATFAALMNRPTDCELKTFVKSGAYYTIGVDTMELFGLKTEESLEKYFSREGVGQTMGSNVQVRYKPSTMELSINGWAEISGY